MAFEIENGVLKELTNDEGNTEIVIPEGVTEIADDATVCFRFSYECFPYKVVLPISLQKIGKGFFSGLYYPFPKKYGYPIIVMYGVEINLPEIFRIHGGYYTEYEYMKNHKDFDKHVFNDYACEYYESKEHKILPVIIDELNGILSNDFSKITKYIPMNCYCQILESLADHNTEARKLLQCIKESDIKYSCVGKYSGKEEVVVIPYGVKEIGYNAFYGCTNVKKVVIPESVIEIKGQAFAGCTNLESVMIPNRLKIISGGCFKNCISLSTIILPDDITEIEYDAFKGCTGLKALSIGDSLSEISFFAFKNCTGLTNIKISEKNDAFTLEEGILYNKNHTEIILCSADKKSINILASVNDVNVTALGNCLELKEIKVDSNNQNFTCVDGILYSKDLTEILKLPMNRKKIEISESVKTLTGVIITNSLECITVSEKNSDFASIDGALYDKAIKTLIKCPAMKTELTIPETVERIEPSALEGCYKLSTVIIKGKNKIINKHCLYGWEIENHPDVFINIVKQIYQYMDDEAIKLFILNKWKTFEDQRFIAEIFLNKHTKFFCEIYESFEGDKLNNFGKYIPDLLGVKPSAKLCNAAADFIKFYYFDDISTDILKAIYDAIKGSKSGAKAAEMIEADYSLD